MLELTPAQERAHELSNFASLCVELYKRAHGLTGAAAFRLLDEGGALSNIEAFYDSHRTQPAQQIVRDLEARLGGAADTNG